jgi:hypothetical protein
MFVSCFYRTWLTILDWILSNLFRDLNSHRIIHNYIFQQIASCISNRLIKDSL